MQVETMQYIIATIDKEHYGFNVKNIDSIIEMHKITRVPGSQEHFLGVINLRGDIIPVMSLRRKLGLAEDKFTDISRIIIVKADAESVGIAVDDVKEVITLDVDNIEMLASDKDDINSNYNIGVGKHGEYLINLLNIPKLILKE